MIEHSTPTVIANPDDEDVRLSREQLWQGLVWKAKYAQLFVAPIRECRILETFDDGFLREVVIQMGDNPQEVIQERVFLEPMERVTFLRLNGSVYGQIVNIIETDDDDESTLRFTFTLALEGAEHGGPEERSYEEEFAAGYLDAVKATLDAVREFVRSGEDPTELANRSSEAVSG